MSDAAAASKNKKSEFFYGGYRDLEYNLLTSNAQFMDPPVPQTVNGVPDAYSKQFFDDFGPGSANVTYFTAPPFAGSDIVMVANSICGSTCSIFSSYLYQKHGVRSAVFGGRSGATGGQFDGGVKGSEVTSYAEMLYELRINNLSSDAAAPQPLPVRASLTMNFRNAIPYVDQQDGILEYVYEPATKKVSFLFSFPLVHRYTSLARVYAHGRVKHPGLTLLHVPQYSFTKQTYNNPQAVWEFVAGEFFGNN